MKSLVCTTCALETSPHESTGMDMTKGFDEFMTTMLGATRVSMYWDAYRVVNFERGDMLASTENFPLLRDVAREERPEVRMGKWSKRRGKAKHPQPTRMS